MKILMTSIVDLKKSQHNRPHQFVKYLSKNHEVTVLSINDWWKGGQDNPEGYSSDFDDVSSLADHWMTGKDGTDAITTSPTASGSRKPCGACPATAVRRQRSAAHPGIRLMPAPLRCRLALGPVCCVGDFSVISRLRRERRGRRCVMALLAALPGFLRAAEKSSLTSTPSGILSDGFICDCEHTDYCEDRERWVWVRSA